MTQTEKALAELNQRILCGSEFPDVVGRIARKFRITERRLAQSYDAQWDKAEIAFWNQNA